MERRVADLAESSNRSVGSATLATNNACSRSGSIVAYISTATVSEELTPHWCRPWLAERQWSHGILPITERSWATMECFVIRNLRAFELL